MQNTLSFWKTLPLRPACIVLAIAACFPDARAEEVISVSPAAAAALQGTVVLGPRTLVQLLVARSAEIEYSKLQVEVSSYLSKAETALYDPVLFSTVRHEDRERQRGIEERLTNLAASRIPILEERVDTAELGVRNRLPTGGEASVSYKLRDKRNNIIASGTTGDHEYDGSLVLTLKQPLMRGRGRDIVETDKRIAEVESRISLFQYRQQLLKTCSDALSVYWQLYRALEVHRIRRQALDNARQILADTEARIKAGKAPSSNLLEVKAAMTIREVEYLRAEQGVREAESRLATMLNISAFRNHNVKLTMNPQDVSTRLDIGSPKSRYENALGNWPPLQIAKLRSEQAGIRLNYADNQRLPAVDLLLSRSNTGLANNSEEARSITETGRYPEWYVGLSMEIPLPGNRKADSQYNAQVAKLKQTQVEIESIENALGNEIRTRSEQAVAALQEVDEVMRDVQLRTELLRIERIRYESGMSLLSLLLQREAELNESRQRLVESSTRLGQANVALMMSDGTLLDQYGIQIKE